MQPANTRHFTRTFTEQDLPDLLALCDHQLSLHTPSRSTATSATSANQRLLLFRSRLQTASAAFALRHQLQRHKPLPVLTHDPKNVHVTMVDFGSNFPLDSQGPDRHVCIQFKEPRITLWLLVPQHHTKADILHALTTPSAPPVIVHDFTTRF